MRSCNVTEKLRGCPFPVRPHVVWLLVALVTATSTLGVGVARDASLDARLIMEASSEQATPRRVAVIRDLVKAGANVDGLDQYGTPVLSAACMKGPSPITEALLELGADTEVRGSDDMTPLLNAAYTGNAAMAVALLDAGADANVHMSRKDWTPLMFAAKRCLPELVQALLDNGASTALYWADDRPVCPNPYATPHKPQECCNDVAEAFIRSRSTQRLKAEEGDKGGASDDPSGPHGSDENLSDGVDAESSEVCRIL